MRLLSYGKNLAANILRAWKLRIGNVFWARISKNTAQVLLTTTNESYDKA
jgi:hypothetical protein